MVSFSEHTKNAGRQLDHEEIDEFLHCLNESINRRRKQLEEQYANTTNGEHAVHLENLHASLSATKSLGDELSIIALYEKVESHTIRLVEEKVPLSGNTNLSYFKNFCQALPFKIEDVDGYAGLNELRLLNNSIKHNGGKVSIELAREFPQ